MKTEKDVERFLIRLDIYLREKYSLREVRDIWNDWYWNLSIGEMVEVKKYNRYRKRILIDFLQLLLKNSAKEGNHGKQISMIGDVIEYNKTIGVITSEYEESGVKYYGVTFADLTCCNNITAPECEKLGHNILKSVESILRYFDFLDKMPIEKNNP